MSGLAERLAACLAETACLVGMGNPMRGDDGAGVLLAEALAVKPPAGATVLVVEDVLENFVFRLAKGPAKHVILLDAVVSGGAAGSVLFDRLSAFSEGTAGFSTHKASLSLAAKVLEQHGKVVWLLGIEGVDMEFGAEMTPAVGAAVASLTALIQGLLPRELAS